ncbi:MAG: cell division protein ZapA [Cytophagales bacterium]|nr:cell division protein ZapA [Cytophagales bacterium]
MISAEEEKKLHVNIKIGDKAYGMWVLAKNEYQARKTAKEINEELQNLSERTKIFDYEKLLAIHLFNLKTRIKSEEEEREKEEKELKKDLLELRSTIQKKLNTPI